MKSALLLLAAVQASPGAPPPRAEPFDCSWIYHPPTGARERFEGVYFSFIDNSGFVACRTARACKDWMGKGVEISATEKASAQLARRLQANYGVFKIVFEGRRGRLGTRTGCEDDPWSLELTDGTYVQIEKVLSVRPLEDSKR
jgi:hypothetical protein